MTLMEAVIAIGVIAFVVPLILAATASSGNSRRSAEADTRSAWLAREIQRQVLIKWSDDEGESIIDSSLSFPTFGSEGAPIILAFDIDGNFLEAAASIDLDRSSKIPKAVYLVSFYGEEHVPTNQPDLSTELSLLRIRIHSPATASPATRATFRYNLVTPRQGTL